VLFLMAAFTAGGYAERTSALLCAAVWLTLALAASVRRPPRLTTADLAILSFAALTLMSGLWGHGDEALRAAPLAGLYAGVLYGARWAATGDPTRVVGYLRYAIAIVAVAAIAGRATGWAGPELGAGSVRMSWPLTYADGLGLVCAIGVVLCLCLRPVWLPGAVACGVALVWTFSRSAILGCIVALALLAVAQRRVPRGVAIGVAVAASALVVTLAPRLLHSFARPAPDTRSAARLLSLSGHGRTTLWRTALTEGLAHPVVGGGAGSWQRSATAQTGRPDLPRNAHSLVLETFAELGLVGVALLSALVAAVVRIRGEPVLTAVFLLWLGVAAVDWDWQLPAATLPAMVVAGALGAVRP
jgi:O-antigen ligase